MFRHDFDYLYNDILAGPSRGYGYFGVGLGDSVEPAASASCYENGISIQTDYLQNRLINLFRQRILSLSISYLDTSKGRVAEEIVKFHLVPDMAKKFNKMFKEHGCAGTHRKLTREEQDRINKHRRSAYLQKHPELRSTTSPAAATFTTETSVPLQNTINRKRGR